MDNTVFGTTEEILTYMNIAVVIYELRAYFKI